MRRPILLSLAALASLAPPLVAEDLCPWATTIRGTVSCPVGVSSSICASTSGAPLTYTQADKNFLNTVGLCAAEDRIVVTGAVCAAGELPVFTVDGWVCSVLSGVPGRIGSGQLPVSFNAPTATALAANPPACSVGQYVTDIAADGTPTCAQVQYSQVAGAPAAGIGGALGALDNAVPRTVGAGGSTVEGTTLTIDDANNLVLGAGAALSGSDNYVRVRTPGGGYNVGNGTFQDSGGAGRSWLINLSVSGSGTQPVYSGAGDQTTGSGNCATGAVCLTASGVEALRATTTSVKVLTLGLTISSAPPYACAGATEGHIYADAEDHAPCYCTGAAWAPMFGGGSCG